MTCCLLIVDMQSGFINEHTRHILEPVQALLGAAQALKTPTALTRFVNHPESGYVRWIGWSRFMGPPETDLAIATYDERTVIFDKTQYSAFTQQFEDFIKENDVSTLIICGIATDGCVLKTAVDAFERGIQPIVVLDACASHAGREVHEAGLLLLRRFIGAGQLQTAREASELIGAK